MNGLINMNRILTVSIVNKEGRNFLVFNNGSKKRFGMEVPTRKEAEELLDFIMRKRPAYFRVKTEMVNVDKLKDDDNGEE